MASKHPTVDHLRQRLEEHPDLRAKISDSQIERIWDIWQRGDYGLKVPRVYSALASAQVATVLANQFADAEWRLLVARPPLEFVTCDKPLVKAAYESDASSGRLKLQYIIPLDKSLCLIMVLGAQCILARDATANDVEQVNRLIAVNTDRYLMGSRASLVRSFNNL